jgi:hypothetical protein
MIAFTFNKSIVFRYFLSELNVIRGNQTKSYACPGFGGTTSETIFTIFTSYFIHDFSPSHLRMTSTKREA